MADLSKVTVIRSSGECLYDKYNALDDAGVVNLIEMAQRGEMTNPARIEAALQVATERSLVAVEG